LREVDNIRLRKRKFKIKLKYEKPTKGRVVATIGKVDEITQERNKNKPVHLQCRKLME